MDPKVTGKCLIEQGSGMVIDKAGNKLPAKFILFCKMMPFIITKDSDIDKFEGEEMDSSYQANDQYFNFFEEEVKDLQAKKSKGIITSVSFLALTGSRHKIRRRQMTGIPPTPVMMGTVTPVTATDIQATTIKQIPAETVPEPIMSVSVTVIPMQPPMLESQLGGSYINNPQVHH